MQIHSPYPALLMRPISYHFVIKNCSLIVILINLLDAAYNVWDVIIIWNMSYSYCDLICILPYSTYLQCATRMKTFKLSRFITVMDLNDICKTCHRKVQSFSENLTCKNCKAKYHKKCIRLATEDTVNIDLWYCPYCTQSILPFNHYDDDELFTQAIVECQLDCSFR